MRSDFRLRLEHQSPVLSAILDDASFQLDEVNPYRQELESIITALEHLPPRTDTDPERVKERRREKEIIKRRLSSLVTSSKRHSRSRSKDVLRDLNGEKDKPESLDRLEELLAQIRPTGCVTGASHRMR